MSLVDCNITENRAGVSAGGIHAAGAPAAVTCTRCRICGNEAATHGGGLLVEAQSAQLRSNTSVVMTDSVLSDNRAPNGAGMYKCARPRLRSATRPMLHRFHVHSPA